MIITKKTFKQLLFAAMLFTMPFVTSAQTPGDPGDDPDEPPSDVPIDGGLSLLLAAGVGFVIKKAYDKHMHQVSFSDGRPAK